MVLRLELWVVNSDVLLDIALRKLDFVILARTIHAHKRPVRHCYWHTEEQEHENIRLEAASTNEGKHALDEPWDDDDDGGKVDVAECAVALCEALDGRVLNRRGVRRANRVVGHDGLQ